ncbi:MULTISPECIES: hypothetical protein [Bacillus]|uniref:Fur-regulated basic protein FbpA n=1 Tax=Bacillus glycinifermentans TaxID=1664069 RepID=A0ABU6H8Z3_9BACI|nr:MULTISPECIES: hypothetical protein [Bacillus]AOP16150.1 hypothetical protein BL1202_03204 [Bacillus licheniformis]ARC74582.1 hypothetical protein B37_02532 [Bacillus licheniformis]ARW43725.1 hypothetical protein S100141_02405 [Bacillus licheniformis]ARW55089.1 hypothetical protein S100027_03095 [Bacillus licheniformis]MDQ9098345.1 hypothetical protein [Bacillus licheniformis]
MKPLSDSTKRRMAEFFMRTSIPRILAREQQEKDMEKESLKTKGA